MSDFFVLGGGGHARVLIQGLQAMGHTVRGYIAPKDAGVVRDVPYLGSDSALDELKPQLPDQAALGIGKVAVESPRNGLIDRMLGLGFCFPALVMLQAQVHDDVTLGDGTVVMDGAVVVTGSRLGRVCIVNTNATIDHDCMLGDDVHVASGATLSGGVEVGDRCMIGTGASLIHEVRVCANCLIGAGATVVHDIDMPGTYVGTPARRVA